MLPWNLNDWKINSFNVRHPIPLMKINAQNKIVSTIKNEASYKE